MSYLNLATSKTPAHIIYVIDASGSMAEEMEGTNKRKIDIVSDMLEKIAYQIYLRTSRGKVVFERYRIAIFAYNNKVIEITNGDYISVKEFINDGVPEFSDLGNSRTNTFQAMLSARDLVKKTISKLKDSDPPPIVCHLTDGHYTEEFGNPSEIMNEIMNLETFDGNVLLENIYLGSNILNAPVSKVESWNGIIGLDKFNDSYARFLYEHSSIWPNKYISYFNNDFGFNIAPGARMFFPADNIDLIELAFTASSSTPRGESAEALEENREKRNIFNIDNAGSGNTLYQAGRDIPVTIPKTNRKEYNFNIDNMFFGNDDAEADEKNGFLSRVFLKTSIYTRVMKSQRELVVGRKGAGKSAICIMLRNALETERINTLLITPKFLSSSKIEESRISSINQEELYYLLWKYTLLVSVGRKIYDNINQSPKKLYKNNKNNIKMVRSFLVDNDEIEKNFLEKIFGKSNIFSKFTIKAFGMEGSAETKQLQAQKDFANELDKFQENLQLAVGILKLNNFVVLIDKVDDLWTHSKEAELMITGLIKSVHELNVSMSSVHFILFLRSDIYDNMTRFNDADKLHSVEERISWSKDDLKHLIANRGKISLGLSSGDTNEIWGILFDEKVNDIPSFDYMIDKTLYKPRDIIQFCNEALSCAQNNNHQFITSEDILSAEKQYSIWKMKDAMNEFSVQYPYLGDVFNTLKGFKEKFTLLELESRINNFTSKSFKDSEVNKMKVETLAQILFNIGIFGVELEKKNTYFHDDIFLVISSDNTLLVHPAYHYALGYKSAVNM